VIFILPNPARHFDERSVYSARIHAVYRRINLDNESIPI